MDSISLNLDGKECRILIGSGILGSTGKLVSELSTQRFAVITNPKVNSLYGKQVAQSLKASGFSCETFIIADSENSKSLEQANTLYGELADKDFGRDSCVIGLGGGVVGDLAGFVAATYLRGIELVHIPTSLLAQVDSAIGGKTGVNLPQGKNLVGAFHQPALVISDIMALKTLPENDYRSGLAEVVKYGMALDAELFAWLEDNAGEIIKRNERSLEKTVATCCAIKAKIVEKDERDHGKRIVLNFGHTLGHALEAASGYGYSHGEAVAIGMLFAAKVSVKSGTLKEKELERLSSLISGFGLPTRIEKPVESKMLLEFMNADKKRKNGKIRMVLPTCIGEAVVSEDVSRGLILAVLEEMSA